MADGVVKFEVQYDTSKATTSLDSIKNKAKSVGDSTKTMSKVAGGALAGVVGGVVLLSSKYDKLAKDAKALSISSAGSLAAMQHASSLFGIENDKLVGTLEKVNKSLALNEDKFNSLGIVTRDASGELLGSDQVFMNMIQTLGNMDTATRNQTLAQLGLGREISTFNKVLVDGDGYVKEYSNHLSENEERTNKMAIASEWLQDAITILLDKIKQVVVDIILWIKENQNVALAIGAVLLVLALVAPVMSIVGGAITIFNGIQKLFQLEIWKNVAALAAQAIAFIAANLPIILITLGIIALIGVLVWLQKKFDIVGKAVDLFKKGFEIAGKVVKKVMEGIKGVVKGAANIVIGAINLMIGALEMLANGGILAFNGLKALFNIIPGINMGMTPKISIPRVPSLAIGTDRVMSDGLAMIHKGEAIVPADVVGGGFSGQGGMSVGNINIRIDGNADKNTVDYMLGQLDQKLGGMLGVNYYARN